MTESSPKGWRVISEKEKLLVTSNFFFSHGDFERLLQQISEKKGLFEKGLTLYHTIPTFNNPGKEAF